MERLWYEIHQMIRALQIFQCVLVCPYTKLLSADWKHNCCYLSLETCLDFVLHYTKMIYNIQSQEVVICCITLYQSTTNIPVHACLPLHRTTLRRLKTRLLLFVFRAVSKQTNVTLILIMNLQHVSQCNGVAHWHVFN